MKYLHFIVFSLGVFSLNAQEISSHEYFVEWKESNRNLNAFIKQCNSQLIDVQYINSYKPFGVISFPPDFDPQKELEILKNEPLIKNFNRSRPMLERGCAPNDPQYNKQWNLGKMEFDEVWCYGNDGISPLGDTLVIGLMDYGFDYNLADILPNVFSNNNEIPDNSIDDDGNGYIDDYYGYSPISLKKDDDHPIANHGTEVISIMGAKGNNLRDITGSAQNVKVLLCSGNTEAHMVSCYTYFYRMKELYLQSGGTKGAFVVATSLSLGFDFSFPEEFPNICPLYDWLGTLGILNVCATVNKPDHDVAIKGDVPSLCPSDFLITVTNTDINDRFVTSSGYSNIHIDLGASGETVPVIQMGGGIDFSAGCSLSAPQVAAGILLLNQFCLRYAELLKNTPAEAAKLLKSMILNCGDPLATLQDITVSGKRFNVFESMLCLERYCNSLQDQSFIKIVNNPIQEGKLKINLGIDQFGPYTLRIINSQGQIIDQIVDDHLPGSMDQFLERNISHYPSGVYYIQFLFGTFKESKGFIKY